MPKIELRSIKGKRRIVETPEPSSSRRTRGRRGRKQKEELETVQEEPESPLTPLPESRSPSRDRNLDQNQGVDSFDSTQQSNLDSFANLRPSLASQQRSETAFDRFAKRLLEYYLKQKQLREMARTEADMPAPHGRDAPSYRGDPHTLKRFLESVTDLLKQNNVTDVQRKKEWLGKYADTKSEGEWQALETYEAPASFEEHKQGILFNYWETRREGEGSIALLDSFVRSQRGLRLEDPKSIFDFIRQFRKLAKPLIAEGGITNRELVIKILSALHVDFKRDLEKSLETMSVWKEKLEKQELRLRRLENPQAAAGAQAPPAAPQARNVEDKYTMDEVLKEITRMAERWNGSDYDVGNQDSRREYDRPRTPIVNEKSVRFKTEELESQIEGLTAIMKDHMVLSEKRDQLARSDLRALNELIRTQMQAAQSSSSGVRKEYGGGSSRSFQVQNKSSTDTCFYCGETGHIQTDCEHRQRHLKEGLIILENGSFRMPGGFWFPKLAPGENKTPRERVEEYYAQKKRDAAQANAYEIYDFLRNDRVEVKEPTYGSYTLLTKPREEEDLKSIGARWDEFQEFKAFLKTRSQQENEEGQSF